jgi:hypothetical protein
MRQSAGWVICFSAADWLAEAVVTMKLLSVDMITVRVRRTLRAKQVVAICDNSQVREIGNLPAIVWSRGVTRWFRCSLSVADPFVCRCLGSPLRNSRIVMALVSMVHSITSLPEEFRTAIEIASL